jgi:hypothetical protein
MGRRLCIGKSPTPLPVGMDGAVISLLGEKKRHRLQVAGAVALTDRKRQESCGDSCDLS